MVSDGARDARAGATHSLTAAFEQALKEVEEFSATQTTSAAKALTDDNFDQLNYRWSLADVVAGLRDASSLVRAGAAVELRLVVDGTTLALTADGPDEWRAAPDPTSLLEHLRDVGAKAVWTTE